MKSKILITAWMLAVWMVSPLFAQERYIPGIPPVVTTEEKNYAGEVVLTPTLLFGFKGQKAKFNEYRDLRDGVYGAAALKYDADRYYLDFGAADVGYKTQTYNLDGGWWGTGRFHLGFDQMPHNFWYGARTPFDGVGGNTLTINPPRSFTNPSTWNSFDYSIDRKNYEAGFKIDVLKPFYFDVVANRVEKSGIFPIGAATTSPGGFGIELPIPIDYNTNNIKLEAGYAKNPLFLSLSYFYSQFDNRNSTLNFINPAAPTAGSDAFTLPPDNSYYKINLKGAVKLPFNSKFNADIATSRTEADYNLLTSYVAGTPRTLITLSDALFNGRLNTQNYAFSLTSSPLYWLDAKVFYKYYKRDNGSDVITTTDPTQTPTAFNNYERLFEYWKESEGVQLGFTLPAKFYLTTAYTHAYTKRKREDIPKNNDDIYAVDLRWSGLDWMVARAGFEFLHRDGEFEGTTFPVTDLEPFLRRYDVAANNRYLYKATFDFFPVENLTLTVGGRYRTTNYTDAVLGIQRDKRGEFNIDADYLLWKRIRLFANFNYERVKFDQTQRQIPAITTPSGAALFDPNQPPSPATGAPTAFNWRVSPTERNWAYGVGTEIYVVPNRLTFRFQYSWIKSDGTVDYTYLMSSTQLAALAPGGRTQDNIDINNWDNYHLEYYLAKATYQATKALSFSLAWAYERYKYDDAQYNGYVLLPATTGTNADFLTGAYSNPDYRANIIFLSAAYKF